MSILYRIVDWADKYENNRTRELIHLSWVPIPNAHDGDGYTFLLEQEDGEALFGAWIAVVKVASRCDPRGTLLRDCARPHTAASLARMTRFSEKTISRCLSLLSGPEMGWISRENVNDSDDPAPACDITARSCDDTATGCLERKKERTERKKEQSDQDLSLLGSRIGGWFHRRPTTKWTPGELRALKMVEKMETPEDDLTALERYYLSNDRYKRQDILTLLNNWPGEIGRAKQKGYGSAQAGGVRRDRNGNELLTHFADGTPVPIITEEGSGHYTGPNDSPI